MRIPHRGVVTDYTHEGKGIVKYNGQPIFVADVMKDEDVEIVITKLNKTYGFGSLVERHSTSSHRVTPPCPYYESCGGCQIQHFSYEEQLRFKQGKVIRLLQQVGVHPSKIAPIIGMENPFYYRNKVQVPFGMTYDGKVIAGFYAPQSHDIIDMDRCLIENVHADGVLTTIRQLVNEFHIEPYDDTSHRGVLRHVLIRQGQATGQLMVVLITRTPTLPREQQFVQRLLKAHPDITTIIHNHNGNVTNVILGEKERILFGPGSIEDVLSGLRFKIAAKSFFQVNAVQTEVLYQKAIDYADIQSTDYVLDAYCGVGTIGMLAARKAKWVDGIEVIPDAIQNAIYNAKINQIANIAFAVGDAGDYLVKQHKLGKTYDVVIVDPPRQGLSEAFIHTLLRIKPRRISYVSCDPATLARDIKILSTQYEVQVVQPVDMFPQTFHVETVCLLSYRQP